MTGLRLAWAYLMGGLFPKKEEKKPKTLIVHDEQCRTLWKGPLTPEVFRGREGELLFEALEASHEDPVVVHITRSAFNGNVEQAVKDLMARKFGAGFQNSQN